METISFGDFKKLDIRIGTIVSAEAVERADALFKLTVDTGDSGPRTLVAGIAEWYTPDELVGRQIPVLTNLEPKTLRGVESQGMILAADANGKPVLLSPKDKVAPGTIIR